MEHVEVSPLLRTFTFSPFSPFLSLSAPHSPFLYPSFINFFKIRIVTFDKPTPHHHEEHVSYELRYHQVLTSIDDENPFLVSKGERATSGRVREGKEREGSRNATE